MSRALPTIEELASYLSKSALNTLVVEGDDDVIYLRHIENFVEGLNVLPVGGKDGVISLFQRRTDYSSLVLFCSDSDDWCVVGHPPDISQSNVFFTTDGYSLENDLIRDSQICGLFNAHERGRFSQVLSSMGGFMAAAVSKPRNQRFDFGVRLSVTFDMTNECLTNVAVGYEEADPADAPTLERVTSDPLKFFRGKTLLQVISKIFAERNGMQIDVRSVLQTAWTRDDGFVLRMAQAIQDHTIPSATTTR
jgi:hypothetical protein